jgi:hypothetical protein
MSDLFCHDFVVLRMGANETDINNLKLVLDGYDQPVRIPLDSVWMNYSGLATEAGRRPDD